LPKGNTILIEIKLIEFLDLKILSNAFKNLYGLCIEKALQRDEQASWKRLKTDPVRLYSWYKTFWDVHGLNNNK
jgi:hypothetical protein